MNTTDTIIRTSVERKHKRYISLDFARGIAIFIMLFLHIVQRTLDIEGLMADEVIATKAIINLVALILIPFFGGLAGFFLIISAASNMVSMYKHLRNGKSVKSLVIKQIIGGLLLLVFAMLCEGLIGYQGLVGAFFRSLDNPAATNWEVLLWRWNFFETIHTIAWCLIINGIVQGLLSLKGNWQNTKRLIISYVILAVVVVGLTQPIWMLVGLIVPGYPFGTYAGNEHVIFMPWIGTESFWQIFRTPFLGVLASPMEPLFPYLAVSFIGSIIGIVLSKPKEEISKKFPRNTFLVGIGMFVAGLIGIFFVILQVMSTQGIDGVLEIYMDFPNHRAWSPNKFAFIPMFAWLGQFLAVTGFSLILVILLFRLIEFRGKSEAFANRTKIIRRFGTVAFTNYNNQWIFFFVFFLTSLLFTGTAYQKFGWGGTFTTIIVTYSIYSLILFGWEKINYIGSLEWIIRSITNNVVPTRRQSFDPSVKWWQRGQVDVKNTFYNASWINLVEISGEPKEIEESRLALRLSLIGFCSILFIVLNIISLFITINARKVDGKNRHNTAALIISILGITVIVAFIVVGSILPIGVLGIF